MNVPLALQPELIDDLCQFIRIPSRSSLLGGEEGQLQTVIAQRMGSYGARVRTFEAGDVAGFFAHPLCCGPERQYTNRPTVVGELGPENAPALLILAHSDTVPLFKPKDWSFDPFGGELRDNGINGLGSCDDKWGLACLLGLMRFLGQQKHTLKKKLIFASTIDEENGVGNGTLLLTLAGIKAEAALYLDGVNMDLCLGNLGGSFFFLRPCQPLADAVMADHAQRLRQGCAAMSRRRIGLFEHPLLQHNFRRENSLILYEWQEEQGPFFNIAFYTVPGEDHARFCQELESMVHHILGGDLHGYQTSYLEPWFESAMIDPTLPSVQCMQQAMRTVLQREPTLTTISKQDSFVLTNLAHIPTLAFGPRCQQQARGSSHQPDEYLPVEDLWNAFEITCHAVDHWLNC